MPAELVIILNDKNATLELSKNGRVVDSLKFLYYYDLDRKLTPLEAAYLKRFGFIKRGQTRVYKELLTGLITNIDKLLKGTKIDINSVKSYKIQGNLGDNATSTRIAEAVVEGLRS